MASTTSIVSFTVVDGQVLPGSLDVTFNSTGIVLTDIDTFSDSAAAVAIQSDGKIVAVGSAQNPLAGGYNFALVRYKVDGSLDTSFGTNGKVTTDFGTSLDIGRVMAIQSNGKIIVAGSYITDNTGAPSGLAMARYNTNGSLDTTFGTSGMVTSSGSIYDFPKAISIQADDKIIVASSSFRGFSLMRYTTDGILDTSFGTTGRVYTAIFTTVPGNDSLGDIVIQADGKIVAVGITGPTRKFALVRYNVDGSLDATFGTDGIVTTNIGGFASASAVAIQEDGKIVAAGSAIVRYNTDGSLDMTFGTDGKSTGSANVVLIQGDGKLVTVVTKLVGGSSGIFSLARHNIDGSFDSSFGTNGKLTTSVGVGPNTLVYDAVLQTDGKIVAVGTASGDFAIVRYLP